MSEHHDDTQRDSDTTGQGYPEEGPPGSGIDAHDHAEDEVTPDHEAPRTESEEEGEPGQATGNPRAAGG